MSPGPRHLTLRAVSMVIEVRVVIALFFPIFPYLMSVS
jgi:hypothetical protein